MSDELTDLYQEQIMDHSRHPQNRREMPDADRTVEGYNPMCGDQVKVYLRMRNSQVDDVSFTGTSCAICTASASMMTQSIKGKSETEAMEAFEWFHDMLTAPEPPPPREGLELVASLSGIRRYPMRVKCATLAWHALRSALLNDDNAISTE